MSVKLSKSGIVDYPPLIDLVAGYLGPFRDALNASLMDKVDHFRRDGYNVNVLGIAGELVVHYVCWSHGISYEPTPLIDLDPVRDCDLVVGPYRIDVKACRKDSPVLMVNCEAHHKSKGVTHYWFVDFMARGKARYWIFPKGDIDRWPSKKFVTEAYFKPIAELENVR